MISYKKALGFLKQHKIFTILLFIIILYTVLLPFSAINFPSGVQSTFSIAFDKPIMLLVNKISVETPKGVTFIDDPTIVKEIVDATKVATNANLDAIYGSYYIRLYINNIPVRKMDLSLYYNSIRVYRINFKYFITNGAFSGGQVFVSDELLEQLKQCLMEHGNSFGGITGDYLYPETPLR